MQYNYSKKMFIRRAKPVRMIGDPDNQRPDNWSSTAFVLEQPKHNLHFSRFEWILRIVSSTAKVYF
jgi:hypothetical protein